jgi:hypothetical protein
MLHFTRHRIALKRDNYGDRKLCSKARTLTLVISS